MQDRYKNSLLHKTLSQYFEFDGIIGLARYGVSLDGLYDDLKPLCKNKYKNNYRFVFKYFDTDYYITKDQPGLILRNLQRILRELDISNYFCILVTQQDLQQELDQLRDQETTDDCSIYCLQHHLEVFSHFDDFDVQLNINKIDKNFICLNRVKRKHRTILYYLLKDKNLLDKGIVSYGSRQ